MHKTISIIFSLLLLVSAAGCSDQIKLGGNVTFDDGSSVESGTVFFATDTSLSQGSIKNGKYIVGTNTMNDGIPKGSYRVYIGNVETVTTDKAGNDVHTPLIDPKYLSDKTSGLTFTADGKTKQFDIKLDRAK